MKKFSNSRVLHIIDSLEIGGAEKFLSSLVIEHKSSLTIKVIVINRMGPIGKKLSSLGFDVVDLSLSNSLKLPYFLLRFFKEIKSFNPDVVHTWMYHSNFLGGTVSWLAGFKRIIWSIHNFNIEKGILKPRTRMLIKILSRISYFIPLKIIYCSKASSNVHIQAGFDKKKTEFIPNGVEIPNKFNFSYKKSREGFLNLPNNKFIIGMVGRYDIQKNHIGFFESLKILKNRKFNFHTVIVGRGCDKNNHILNNIIKRNVISNFISMYVERDDISNVLQCLDLFVMPSIGEAFPISLCEAMANSVPCIGNDVGDVSYIIGDPSLVIPSWDPEIFADLIIKIGNLSEEHRKAISERQYSRVKENFSIQSVGSKYLQMYMGL